MLEVVYAKYIRQASKRLLLNGWYVSTETYRLNPAAKCVCDESSVFRKLLTLLAFGHAGHKFGAGENTQNTTAYRSQLATGVNKNRPTHGDRAI
jgi:hypothetical protein